MINSRIIRVFKKDIRQNMQQLIGKETNVKTEDNSVYHGYILKSDKTHLFLKNKIRRVIQLEIDNIKEIDYRIFS